MVDSNSKKPGYLSPENTPPEQLSAWERWQMPNMDEDVPARVNAFNMKDPARAHSAAQPVADEAAEPELRPLTAEDLEAIRQAAYEEGLEQGREAGEAKGYDAGYSSGESDLKAAITRIGQIGRVLLEPIPAQDQELEQTLLSLVEGICKRVVMRELSIDSSALLQVVQEAIDAVNPGNQRLRIHLNKQDLDLVQQHLKDSGEWEEGWRIQAHPTITPGGCIIETETSMVDARAERRLAAVINQVYEQQQQALQERSQQHGNVDQLLDEVDAFDWDGDSQAHAHTQNPEADDDSGSEPTA